MSKPDTPDTDSIEPLPTDGGAAQSRKRESSHRITKVLVAPYTLVRLCLVVAIIVPLVSIVLVLKIVNDAHQPFRVIAVDAADNFIIGPLKDIDQSPIFERSAKLTAIAALSRTPTGFDHPEMVNSLFYRTALNRIKDDLKKQLPNLKAQNLHQKVEISKMRTVDVMQGGRKIYVYGFLNRFGISNGYSITQSEHFRMILVLSPNPTFGERGQYPYIVVNYALRIGEGAWGKDGGTK
jgi:hypothetical protein